MKRIVLTGLLASVLATGVATASEAPHWSYSGADGPAHWAALAPQFGACNGKNQSPIDLTGLVEAELPPIKVSYSAGGTEVVNNGHTAQVNFGPGSSLMVGGTRYELKQVHFHAPSENHINGKAYPLEAHLVHADKAGNLLVVALMFEEGAESKALAALWPMLPHDAGGKQALARPFAAAALLPANLDYYSFSGSLTTPPCTEGVRWVVIKAPDSASKAQVEAFAHLMHHPNNRPVQPVYARTVLK